jgi:DNA-binding MarR family transcriptional regulator
MNDPVAVPLGFWLRRVDQLFESSMDSVLADENVTRRQWQTLNTVSRHQPATARQVADALTLFVADPSTELDELTARSWIGPGPDGYRLAPTGQAALAALEQKVAAHRTTMFAGVSDEDYRVTVHTLARIVANLDPDDTGPSGV